MSKRQAMPRANRHFLPGHVWHITHRCHQKKFIPSFAESHGCKPVDECEVGTLRSLGEGGYASEGSALRSVWRGATAVRPWGSTRLDGSENYRNQEASYFHRSSRKKGSIFQTLPFRAGTHRLAVIAGKSGISSPPHSGLIELFCSNWRNQPHFCLMLPGMGVA